MARLVRVETDYYSISREDRDKTFNRLKQNFKRRCEDAGIQHDYKMTSVFESKSRKLRRKRRESIARVRQKEIETRILAGERVPGTAKLLKKLLKKQAREDQQQNQ